MLAETTGTTGLGWDWMHVDGGTLIFARVIWWNEPWMETVATEVPYDLFCDKDRPMFFLSQ